jgi:ADP-heptose:LPS heptosyltransferase
VKLLVLEQWALGDLALASPFLYTASQKYDVTLVAKPMAETLRRHFWPRVEVLPFDAPWTAFERKYELWRWPWGTITKLLGALRSRQFDVAVSARRDPRDHLLMALSGAKYRIGFPRLGSRTLLTQGVACDKVMMHRFLCWQTLANVLEIGALGPISTQYKERGVIVVHTGAARMTRVWPLERFAKLIRRLRAAEYQVEVLCDPHQLRFWIERGERATVPETLDELICLVGRAAIFIGNDSGPGHVAAISGIPTFTIFGPQLPDLFAPIHPEAEWVEGAPCPFKPCYDSCRFSAPHCLLSVDEDTVWRRVERFVARHVPVPDGVDSWPLDFRHGVHGLGASQGSEFRLKGRQRGFQEHHHKCLAESNMKFGIRKA